MVIPILIVKNIQNNTMYTMQKLHLSSLLSSIFTFSSISSLHSSINLSINLVLHLQFLYCKYSPKSHDLSHSNLKLQGFQIYPLLHVPFSINYLHSH